MTITNPMSSSPDRSRPRRGALGKCSGLAAATLGVLFLTTFGSVQAAAPVEMEGELAVIIKDDFDHNRFETDYFIQDETGEIGYQLEFERTPPGHLRSGQRVRVRGEPKGKKFRVENLEEQGWAAPDGASVTGEQQVLSQVVDERRAVVLMVNLTNVKVSLTRDQVIGRMFTDKQSVHHLYREASLGQMSFPADSDGDGKPDVFGPFEIPYDNSNCNYTAWGSAADAAAQAAGVNLSLYRHRVYVIPTNRPACGWIGIAFAGCGTTCRAWIGGTSGALFVHELGHNLNMHHAGTDPENDGVINSEYGDISDPMGSSGSNWRIFNAAHLDQMRWYADIPGAIATVLTSGTYDLAAIGMDPWTSGAPAALKIYKPDTKDYYYLSYRQPIGDFNMLSTTYTKGVNVHRYRGSGLNQTSHITTLTDGGLFTDSKNGISVYQVARAGNYATVEVSFGCAPTPPKVSLAPATLTMRPGTSAGFSVSVTEQGTGCGNRSYALAGSGPLPTTVTPSSLTLSAGQSVSGALSANAGGAADGSYPVEVRVTDLDATNPATATTVAGATLIVDGTPPTVPIGLSGSSDNKGAITLSWQATSDALSGVAGYSVYRDGVLLGQATTTGFKDSGTVIGTTYQYSISARDGAGNPSAASSPVAVTATGKAPGKPAK